MAVVPSRNQHCLLYACPVVLFIALTMKQTNAMIDGSLMHHYEYVEPCADVIVLAMARQSILVCGGGAQPVWYENLSGVVIRPDKSRHKHRWSG